MKLARPNERLPLSETLTLRLIIEFSLDSFLKGCGNAEEWETMCLVLKITGAVDSLVYKGEGSPVVVAAKQALNSCEGANSRPEALVYLVRLHHYQLDRLTRRQYERACARVFDNMF